MQSRDVCPRAASASAKADLENSASADHRFLSLQCTVILEGKGSHQWEWEITVLYPRGQNGKDKQGWIPEALTHSILTAQAAPRAFRFLFLAFPAHCCQPTEALHTLPQGLCLSAELFSEAVFFHFFTMSSCNYTLPGDGKMFFKVAKPTMGLQNQPDLWGYQVPHSL